ncbi:MAG: U32 family peptidase [Desulfobacteraceae bacterium]|jgi:putative protease
MNKVELLAPAGNLEKLKIVLHYGADAVYLSGKAFSLRNFSGNFSNDELKSAINLAHAYNAKAYVAINIFARPKDIQPMADYIDQLKSLSPDGVILSDPAVLSLVRRIAPAIPIHLSTQANTTNEEAVRFWQGHGVERINAARELSLEEIFRLAVNKRMDIEAFVHGAMCISYSGRCLLSNYMAQRPSNQGMCCQPCRFQYTLMEETRPDQYFPVAQDDRGTYIFNSKDLCMVQHLSEMIGAGVRALKIEGRMKGIHYAATAVKVYREAIDAYYADPERYVVQPHWQQELDKITSRGYCTGFYLGSPQASAQNPAPPQPPAYALAGKVIASAGRNRAHIETRNQLRVGDPVEIIKPHGPAISDRIAGIMTVEGDRVEIAQPGSRVTIDISTDCDELDLLRRAQKRHIAK